MKGVTELIILSYTRFGENRLVLHTLIRAYGRRSFLARVGKGTGMSLFLPLNILEATVTENPKSQLWNASSFSTRYPLSGIRENLYKNSITLFMSEVLLRTLKEGTVEEGLYDWCVRSILTLDSLGSAFANFPVWFLLELCEALGFRPSLEDVAPFAGESLATLQALLETDFAGSMLVPLSGERRNAAADSLIRYLEFHTESSIHIHSLPVLRELLREL